MEFIPIDKAAGIDLPSVKDTTDPAVVTVEHYMVIYEMDKAGEDFFAICKVLAGLRPSSIYKVLHSPEFIKLKEEGGWKNWLKCQTMSPIISHASPTSRCAISSNRVVN